MFASSYIPYHKTNSFTRIITDYLDADPRLRPFYEWPPTPEGLKNSIEKRKSFDTNREVLVSVLQEQYASVPSNEKVDFNIASLLSGDSFTITTAHQPNLFTGPLYFVYKILHVIRIAEQLNNEWSQYHFVPVYYMGSEDADIEELNHTYISGKKIEWKTDQQGAVGRMLVDNELQKLIAEMEGQLSVEPFGNEFIDLLKRCYAEGKTIQQSTFELVNELFGTYGLVVLIPDHPALKRSMINIFSDDIFNHKAIEIVAGTSAELGAHYDVQAHARDINLFYLQHNCRERIEEKGGRFFVLNTDIEFSKDELKNELENHPEKFSPNVILRGIFQEAILPGIAFIGGGGELAYWMQLKSLFENYKIPFPVLVLRNSFLVVSKKWNDKITRLGLEMEDLFRVEHDIMNLIVHKRSKNQVSLNGKFEKAEELFQSIQKQAEQVDPGLSQHVAAIRARSIKTLKELEKKMIRAEKRKFSEQQLQVGKLRETLFPKNGLQERKENISGFYAKWGKTFIEELYRSSLTLEQKFTILTASGSS